MHTSTMDQVRCCSFPASEGLLQFIVRHSRSFARSWYLPSVGHRGDPVNLRDTRRMQDFFLHSYNMICQLFMTCPHSTVASAMEVFWERASSTGRHHLRHGTEGPRREKECGGPCVEELRVSRSFMVVRFAQSSSRLTGI